MSLFTLSSYFFCRILAKDELVAALRKCAEILKSASTKRMQNVLQQLEDFIGRLEALEGKSDTVCVPICFFTWNYQGNIWDAVFFFFFFSLSKLFTSHIKKCIQKTCFHGSFAQFLTK